MLQVSGGTCVLFSSGLLQSFSLCGRALNRAASKRFFGLLQSVSFVVRVCFSDCYKFLVVGLMQNFSGYLNLLVCVCVLFLSWTVAKLFVVWACSLPGCYKTFLSGYCKVSVSLRVCTFFSGCYKVSRSHYECAIFSGCWMQSFSCRVCVLFSDC